MSVSIQDSVVFVTGANRGIGLAIVRSALERGVSKVYAAVRKIENAQALVGEFGERVVPVQVDVTDRQSIIDAAKVASDANIVINNAGTLKTASPLAEHAIDALNYEMKVNVHGLIEMAQAFSSQLTRQCGAFVQLNSVASLKNFADFATYSASKAASYSITQGLREKWAEEGVQVVSVHPGPIATDMADDAGLSEIAEPPSLVADALFDAVESGDFHVWPDAMAKHFGAAYQGFAASVVEAEMAESPS
ncbi:MAG: SDR family oxidoreductase [Planctomycetota bacterium]